MGGAASTISDQNSSYNKQQVKELVGEHNYDEVKFNELAIDGTIPASKLIELIENHKEKTVIDSNSRKNSNVSQTNRIKNDDNEKKSTDPKILNAEKNIITVHSDLKNVKRKAMLIARDAAREAIEIARKLKGEEDRIAAEKLAEEMATVAVQKKDDDDDNGDDEDDDDDDNNDDDDEDDDDDDASLKRKKKKKGGKEEKIKEEIIDPPNKLPPVLEGVVIPDEQKALIDAKELALKEAIEQYNNVSSEKFKYSDIFILKDFIDDFFYELDRNDRDPNDIKNMLHTDCTLSINTQSLVLKTSEVVAMGFANMFRGLTVKHDIVKVSSDKNPLPKFAAQLNIKVNIKIETDKAKLTLELIDLVKPPTDSIGHSLGLPFLVANIKLISQDARPLYCLPEIAIPKTENDNWELQFKPLPPEPTPEELAAAAEAEEKQRLKKEKAEKRKAEKEMAEKDEDEDEEGDEEGEADEIVEGDIAESEKPDATEVVPDETVQQLENNENNNTE